MVMGPTRLRVSRLPSRASTCGTRRSEIEQQPAWSARFGVVEETTLVPWSPDVVTTSSHEIAEPGTELTDHVTVTGLWPGSSHEIVSTLYGPLHQRPEVSNDVPADTPIVGTVTMTVDMDGVYETDPLVSLEPGFYVWHEVIDGLDDAAPPIGEGDTSSDDALALVATDDDESAVTDVAADSAWR